MTEFRAAVYCRVSTEEQSIENTSLETQKDGCLKLAEEKGLQVKHTILETYSGLTISRPKLQEVLTLIRNGDIDALVIYSTDRFSRDGYDLLTLIRECDCNKVSLHCVTEDLGEGQVGQLINFVRGWASGLEATRIKERTMRGKREQASRGCIPAGFGRYGGYLGLRYDKKKKRLIHIPGQIEIAREILSRVLNGESSSKITRSLQERGALGASGKPIHRSSVNRVMANARAYAGIIEWSGIEIRGKSDPIISEEEAVLVAERLLRNKERSLGFGRRKWLTGRIFCGKCGRRYNLDTRKGCRCNGDDSRVPVGLRCDSPRVTWMELSGHVFFLLSFVFTEPEVVAVQAQEGHDKWEREMESLRAMSERKQAQIAEREKRRKLLSFQHECGGITNEEYAKRLSDIQRESDNGIDSLDCFKKPEPPTAEQVMVMFDRLQAFQPFYKHMVEAVNNPQDEICDKLAEQVRLKIILGPAKEGGSLPYSLDMVLSIPIHKKELKLSAKEMESMVSQSIEIEETESMVSQSTQRYAPQQQPPPVPASHAPVP